MTFLCLFLIGGLEWAGKGSGVQGVDFSVNGAVFAIVDDKLAIPLTKRYRFGSFIQNRFFWYR